MNYCGSAAAQIFLNKLAQEMAESNEAYIEFDDYPIDIPFFISILWQRIKKYPEKYQGFLRDIAYEQNYEIIQKTIADPTYWIVRIFKEDWLHSEDYDVIRYGYEIHFSYDERWNGYCECLPDDDDYREDHKCCGHGCDWVAPSVTIFKCYNYDQGTWNGDEHDYWGFEDSFYKDDLEQKARKEQEDKKLRILELEEQIKNCKKEINNLQCKW